MPDYKPNITPPERKPLTLEVAMEYLRLNTWTTREAVLILNLVDPRSNILNDVDFDHDDDEWDVNIETYELAARRFNKASKPLPVEQWLTWAIKGTEEEPRRQPLSYAEKMLEARRNNDPERLQGLSKTIDSVLKKLTRKLVKLDTEDNGEPTVYKKSALIRRLKPSWPTIERCIRDGSANGLKKAAHAGKHGHYVESAAIKWAKANGHWVERPLHVASTQWP